MPAAQGDAVQAMSAVGLFAGIGGLELGFQESGITTIQLCEIDSAATAVLRSHFPHCAHSEDVSAIESIPTVDVLTAGFPCQDLSMAGGKTGIGGGRSSLVNEVFRLLQPRQARPKWVVLENVPYMLHLDKGRGMRLITNELEALGYSWAYRVIDARSTGLPQRRLRVVLVASRIEDPRGVLFADEAAPSSMWSDDIGAVNSDWAYGFYWTEGKRGLGWAGNAVPTVKGGSSLGIASPPAIWEPSTGAIGTPDIRDVERLQGFLEDWTLPANEVAGRKGARWRLVGNAVAVPVATWLGGRLTSPGDPICQTKPVSGFSRWPNAAWGRNGKLHHCDASSTPLAVPYRPLRSFLRHPLKPLSERATSGFLHRARTGIVNFPDGFLDAVERHLLRYSSAAV